MILRAVIEEEFFAGVDVARGEEADAMHAVDEKYFGTAVRCQAGMIDEAEFVTHSGCVDFLIYLFFFAAGKKG